MSQWHLATASNTTVFVPVTAAGLHRWPAGEARALESVFDSLSSGCRRDSASSALLRAYLRLRGVMEADRAGGWAGLGSAWDWPHLPPKGVKLQTHILLSCQPHWGQ